MQISTRQIGNATIVDAVGDITLYNCPEVRKVLLALFKEKHAKRVIVNLEKVKYIDSAGIGEMVGAYTIVRSANGELKLINLTKRVHDLLQITRLLTVFDVSNDEGAAVRSFK